jgi:acetyltransferase
MSFDAVHYLRTALVPRSLAVVGASHRSESLGRIVMTNVLAAGFRGEIHAVNPKHRSVDGRPCFPSLTALPDKVDLAVVVTGARHVPAIIDDAAAKASRRCWCSPVVRSRSDARRLNEVVEHARRSRVRLLGPNCPE